MTGHPSERLAKYVMGLYGPPSFAQRDRQAQAAWDTIIEKCRATRIEMLDGVRWALKPCGKLLKLTLDADPIVAVEQIRTATSEKKLSEFSFRIRQELYLLATTIERFNNKWAKYLQSIDLSHLNTLRNEFNQNFVIEKECATGSEFIARQGFAPFSAADQSALESEFPQLKAMPRFLRTPTFEPPRLWNAVGWVFLIVLYVFMCLLPSSDLFLRSLFAIQICIGCVALLFDLFMCHRRLRDLDDELDRLTR